MAGYTEGEWQAERSKDSGLYHLQSKHANNSVTYIGILLPHTPANAHLIAAAPNQNAELIRGKEWLSKFVMRFYVEAEKPTYEKMRALYQELDDFQRTFGVEALQKAEGKDGH